MRRRPVPTQIEALLDGVNPYESAEFSMVEEAESTIWWESSEQVLRDLLEPDLYDLLDQHNRLDELREEIRDRDDTDLITDLQKVSPSSLFRYDLDYTMSAQERADACAEIIRVAGLDSDRRTVEEIYGLIDEASYGGRLSVLWSTHPDEAIALAEPVGCDEHGKELTEPCGTVTFTDAHLVILDKWNGSATRFRCRRSPPTGVAPGGHRLPAGRPRLLADRQRRPGALRLPGHLHPRRPDRPDNQA